MHEQQNAASPLLLFATPPPLDKLGALTIYMGGKAQGNMASVKFQPQVIKCREFIFTEPDVIGTPSLDVKENCFHLIAQLTLLESGRLQSRLSRVGLQVTKPYEVSPELYQACLRYTLIARISPNWNKAGQWLIQGRDFLTHTGCVNAVRMDLAVNHSELFFTLEATAVRFSPLKVSCLDILGKSLDAFLNNSAAEIHHSSIASDWCFVLPSMKKGRIISICHDLPEDSPFMSYRDIKRHWKNMYGFRLPESDEGLNYYQIHFGPLGGKLFTYPEICLRARDIQVVPRVDPKPILRSFMQTIQSKFPTICGQPMKLQSKAKFPVADLFESRQEDLPPQPNLTSKMSTKPATYRSSAEMERLLSAETTPVVITHKQVAVTNAVANHRNQIHEQGKHVAESLQFPHHNNSSLSHETSSVLTSYCYESSSVVKLQHTFMSHEKITPLVRKFTPKAPSNTICGTVIPKPVSHNSTDMKHTYTPNVPYPSQITSTRPTETPVKCFSQAIGVISSATVSLNNSGSAHTSNTTVGPTAVARKLFPHFTPKKNLGTQINTPNKPSTMPVVPMFNKQKKFNSLDVKCLLNKQNDKPAVQSKVLPNVPKHTAKQSNTKAQENVGQGSKTVKRKVNATAKVRKPKEDKPEAKRKKQKLKAAEQ